MGASISSLCVVFLPEESLTLEQKKVLNILRASNRSIINPKQEKVTLNFFKMSSHLPLLDEEIQELLFIPPVEKGKAR